MTQALHIFRKDVRCLRWELGVVGALTVAFAWAHIVADQTGVDELSRPSILAYVSSGLLALGWWFLISQVVHEESLVGDRQFWVTRPYSWKHLLSAKLLFVLVCINAPWLVAQMAILAAAGFVSPTGLPKLLWMQLTITLVVLVPAFAMGALTRNLTQMILFVLGLAASVYFLLSGEHTKGLVVIGGGGWLAEAIVVIAIVAGAVAVVFWQYRGRHTAAARLTGAATLLLTAALLVFIPVTINYAATAWIFRQREARAISVNIGEPEVPATIPNWWVRWVPVGFSCTLANVPAGETARAEVMNIDIEDGAGLRWNSGWMTAQPGYEHVQVPRPLYQGIAGKTVTLRTSLYISVARPEKLPLPFGQVTYVPGGGYCDVGPLGRAVFCSAPFNDAYDLSDLRLPNETDPYGGVELIRRSFSPWPANFALSPVFTDNPQCQGNCAVRFVDEQPCAWFRRDVQATVHLPPAPKVQP